MSAKRAAEYFDDLPDGIDLSDYDPDKVPNHIAIIMDGNGRWAQARGLPRSKGHEAGIEGVRAAIRTCSDLGVRYLTIYSFSTENWNRPKDEVDLLMELFAHTMSAEADGLNEENVRVLLIGDMDALPKETRDSFQDAIDKTANNTGMSLVMAVNYGGRDEIVRAVRSITKDAISGNISPEDVDEQMISSRLYTKEIPDPDLLIRTSGEFRISNFLLWQNAYSEFYVTDILWPDFDKYELLKAVLSYQARDRRFGKV
ncbi:MAG: isoprenyl transferase [Coriobacteriales bacterium]